MAVEKLPESGKKLGVLPTSPDALSSRSRRDAESQKKPATVVNSSHQTVANIEKPGTIMEPVEHQGIEITSNKRGMPQVTVAKNPPGNIGQQASEPLVKISGFAEIYTDYQTQIGHSIFRIVGNREQANDLTQDVFIKVYKALLSGTNIRASTLRAF